MTWLITAGIIFVFLAAGVAAFYAFSHGKVYVEMLHEILLRVWPHVMRLARPKDFTPEQLDRIKRGEDPFIVRRPGTGGNR